LAEFSKNIGIISIVIAVFVFVTGIILGKPLISMILFAISMAVAVIPEGLPVVVTIAMAIGLNRMAHKNAIIRKLVAVETLGSCNYICADKTGTITENRMTVVKAFAGNKEYVFTGSGYSPEGEILSENQKITEDESLHNLLLCGLLCNSANLYKDKDLWAIDGDPTEGALIVAAKKFGLNVEKLKAEYIRIKEIPFSSSRQFMATLNKNNSEYFVFVKGSPEKILGFSGQENNDDLRKYYLNMAESGLRILGFAGKKISNSFNEDDFIEDNLKDLDFLGFIGIIDPPKNSAIEAIKGTKDAGIKIIMITGDHKETATAIAKQIGIFEEGAIAITGNEIEQKGEEYLKENVEKIRVYARVSPGDKIDIIKALQDRGNVVAMTGDGVNDAPALKRSNIGVAMGSGTDVAKEASDMILKDDNYVSIFEAVKVGRIIFDNIQKVIFFLLCTSLAESIIIILSLFIGLPLPFLATQILWINLVTNTVQDVALAYEPGEKDIIKRKPRNPEEDIINPFLLKRLLFIGIVMAAGTLFIYWHSLNNGTSLVYARTAAVNTIVLYQFFNVWNARSFNKSVFKINPFSNTFLLISIVFSIVAQIAFVTWKPMQAVFETSELSLHTWIQTVLIALTILIPMEIDKWIRNKKNAAKSHP